jgi:two-component system, chemotaxis family, sensor kinase CheA
LDRSLIEAITDPLTHTIRNAIDHGIESPQVRRSRGKPEHGTVTLRAYHEGGQVHIDISDDGAGVDIEKVRAKAKMVGLFSAEESAVLTEAQLLSSIFMPGFSTKENVSSLSGRGVGMDVVKTRIEHAGGTVQISSVSGSGTTVHMTVPLTLAIIPALIVRNANQQFAVPQVSLNELLRLTADEVQQRIEVIEDSATLRLRGRLLPLVRLSEVLRDTSVQQSAADETCVLVLRSADRTFGLIVDAVTNNEEIVVKPLLPLLQGLSVYSGSTLLGDGSLALILDVLGLARQSGVFSRATSAADIDVSSSRDSVLVDLSSGLLLCGVGLERRVAFPVSSVRRLEEIPKESVQQAGLCTVVPYRDDLLPLVDIAALLYSEATPASAQEMEKWPIVVCTTESGEMGFRVNQVLDIAVAPLRILPAPLSGLLGSAIIDGHITDLIDMSQISRPTAASTGTHPHGRNSTTL